MPKAEEIALGLAFPHRRQAMGFRRLGKREIKDPTIFMIWLLLNLKGSKGKGLVYYIMP
jgi:hypothetical protein